MAGAQNSGGRSAVKFFGRGIGRLGRGLLKGGSTPTRLRVWMVVTALVAVVFGVVGAIGVGQRDASLGEAADAAQQLIAVQNVQVSLVHADALASENYLRGGTEDAAKRALYVEELQRVSDGLVAAGNRVLPDEADRLADVSAQLGEYAGLIEQARANNRQGYPVGAAYLRSANTSAAGMVVVLRDVQTSLRHQVNDNLDRADKAGAWLHLTGWPLLILLVGGGSWVALRFRRLLNVPLAAAGVLTLLLLVVGGSIQGSSMSDAESATVSSLQAADLGAQARSAAFDAHSQEFFTLISRGNGDAFEQNWQLSSNTAAVAVDRLCSRSKDCTLNVSYQNYAEAHSNVRTVDDNGNWDEAVALSLGGDASDAFVVFDRKSSDVATSYTTDAVASLAAAADGLSALRIIVFLAGLAIAALVVVGYGQRAREYR